MHGRRELKYVYENILEEKIDKGLNGYGHIFRSTESQLFHCSILPTWTGQIRSVVELEMSEEKQQPSGNGVKILQQIELNLFFQTLHQYHFEYDSAGKRENIQMHLPVSHFLFC